MFRRVASVACFAAVASFAAIACSKKPPPDPAPTITSASATATVPPIAPNGVAPPVSAFLEAPSEGTPFDQAKVYAANGQYWHARLVLEKKAFSPSGTKQEQELMVTICQEQGDEACLEECGRRLGKKLKLDGGTRRKFDAGGEHREPETDAAHARDLLLKHKLAEAREIMEPKVVDGKATKEDVRLLRQICQLQGDRMCQALCDAKLK